MRIRAWMAALLLLAAPAAPAVEPEDLLPPGLAFQVSGVRATTGEIFLTFDIAPGYALYRDKIQVGLAPGDPVRIERLTIPHGPIYDDPYLGAREQWRHRVIATVRTSPANGPLQLAVKLQGCADVGVCFNPEVRTVVVK